MALSSTSHPFSGTPHPPLIVSSTETPTVMRTMIRKIASLLLASTLLVSACGTPRSTQEQIEDQENRIAALEEALFEATSSTTTASTTTTTPPTTTTATLPVIEEPVALIAEAVGPAVVSLESEVGIGAGILFSTEGYILTASHVVEDFSQVTVRLFDGRTLTGDVVGFHLETDVAVVKIPADPTLPTAELGLGLDLQVGQLAVALGSPFGFDQTVTAGIVSAVDRVVRGVTMIQTDASINPGNSGGPLVDALGRVIGINDIIFTESGDSAGVGFAIDIDLAHAVAEQIIDGVPVQLAFLGVEVSDQGGDTPGARVETVVEDTAASNAGIQQGDVIVAVDGHPITESGDLRVQIIGNRPGDSVIITLVREGEILDIPVVLGGNDG
jgi:serine protease Do